MPESENPSPPSPPSVVPPTPLDRLLDLAARLLTDRHRPGSPWQKCRLWLRRSGWICTSLYVATLILILGAMEFIGDAHWLVFPLLYLPPQGWLLPLLLLMPWCLLVHPKSCLAQLGCMALVLVVFMDFEWSTRPAAQGPVLTVLSNNIGQKGNHRLTPFVEQEKPDLIAMQDARFRGPGYEKAYPDHDVRDLGEFLLISRFPIEEVTPIHVEGDANRLIGARYEVNWEGHRLAVYNVHLPSPRRSLNRIRHWALPLILVAPAGTRVGERREEFKQAVHLRQASLARLNQALDEETMPVILLGDLNLPNHGRGYRRIAGRLEDAFETAGRGYGFTFPGRSGGLLTLFGPWLRLDFVFTDPHWRAVDILVEPGSPSQHRAVVTRLEWKESP